MRLVRVVLKSLSMPPRGTFTCTTSDLALAAPSPASSRPVDVLDARDRKIIGAIIRALHRLLEDDGVAPALLEDQRARIMIEDGKVILLAAVSTRTVFDDDGDGRAQAAPHRLPPLRSQRRRAFAFG